MLWGYWLVVGSCLSVSQMGHVCWGWRLTLTVTLMLFGGGMLPKVVLMEELLADLLSGGAVTDPVVVMHLFDEWDGREGQGHVLGPSELMVVCYEEAPTSDH